jgi:hypothetical protein
MINFVIYLKDYEYGITEGDCVRTDIRNSNPTIFKGLCSCMYRAVFILSIVQIQIIEENL